MAETELPHSYVPGSRAAAKDKEPAGVPVYAIGIERADDQYGMVDGPNPDLHAMLDRSGEPMAALIRFNVDGTHDVLYTWEEDRWVRTSEPEVAPSPTLVLLQPEERRTLFEALAMLGDHCSTPEQAARVVAASRRLQEATHQDDAAVSWYVDAARELDIVSDGVLEIDDSTVLSPGSDDGCYVMAWLWVPEGPCSPYEACDECDRRFEPEDLNEVDDQLLCSDCEETHYTEGP